VKYQKKKKHNPCIYDIKQKEFQLFPFYLPTSAYQTCSFFVQNLAHQLGQAHGFRSRGTFRCTPDDVPLLAVGSRI
jgi:hypothetical protein